MRIVVADDNASFLDAVAGFLGREPGFEVVGRAGSGHEAVRAAETTAPDLILMDMVMPGMNGLETTRLIKARPSAPRVIVVTVHEAPGYRDAAYAAGADGFVAKSGIGRMLVPAIRALFPQTGGGGATAA